MGSLVKTPLSELMATLEVLEKFGVRRDHLETIRQNTVHAEVVARCLTGDVSAPIFSHDMTKEGWTLLERGPRRTITSVSDLELVPFLRSGESRINGEEMVWRARHELNANLGQEDAKWLLEYQSEIPVEWRRFYISFPGTGGDRLVPYLFWSGGRWYPSFRWLGSGWYDNDRLLRTRK